MGSAQAWETWGIFRYAGKNCVSNLGWLLFLRVLHWNRVSNRVVLETSDLGLCSLVRTDSGRDGNSGVLYSVSGF